MTLLFALLQTKHPGSFIVAFAVHTCSDGLFSLRAVDWFPHPVAHYLSHVYRTQETS